MNKVTVSGSDGFWARVRAMLGRGPEAGLPAYGRPEIHVAGKKPRPAQLIDDAFRAGWVEAGDRGLSLCVLAFEMDGYAQYFAAYGREAVEDSLAALETVINAMLPRQDQNCLRSGQAGFVVMLPDMPVLMARQLAARIAAAVRRTGLAHRESHAGHVTLSMGLAVVNPYGEHDHGVLNGAFEALKKAQRRGIARLEIVDYRTSEDKRRKAA